MAAQQPFAPFDLEEQNAEITRKRALADALMKQGLAGPAQGQMVSGHYVGPGIGVVNPLLQVLAGKLAGRQADEASAKAKTEYRAGLEGELGKYFDTREGKPGEVMNDQQAANLMQNDQAPTLAEPVKADPRKAAIGALVSSFPELRALGGQDFAEMRKKPGADYKEHLTQDGTLVRSYHDGRVVDLGNYAKPQDDFTDPYTIKGPSGDVLVRKNKRTGKVEAIDTASKTNIDLGVKGDQEFAKQLAGERAGVLKKSYEGAQMASRGLDALSAASQDLAAGLKSGAPAKIGLAIGKWGKALGLGDDPSIVNTEAYRANMARETFGLIKNLGSGTGISNADREFAEKAAGGEITLDDATMYRLMNVAMVSSANVQLEHNRLVDRNVESNPKLAADINTFALPITFRGNDDMAWDPELKKFVVKGPPPKAGGGPGTGQPRSPNKPSVSNW